MKEMDNVVDSEGVADSVVELLSDPEGESDHETVVEAVPLVDKDSEGVAEGSDDRVALNEDESKALIEMEILRL